MKTKPYRKPPMGDRITRLDKTAGFNAPVKTKTAEEQVNEAFDIAKKRGIEPRFIAGALVRILTGRA